MENLPDEITITYDGKTKRVLTEQYAKAKLKQLREFGYPRLTLDEVNEQIAAVLAKKEFGHGLTAIGMFVEGEVRR